MISGSLCGVFQCEEEHQRKHKLFAIGSISALMIFICLFYSLCIGLCLTSLLPPRIIPAAQSIWSFHLAPCWAAPHAFGLTAWERRRGPGERRSQAPLPGSTWNHILELLQPHKRNAKQIQQAAVFKAKEFNECLAAWLYLCVRACEGMCYYSHLHKRTAKSTPPPGTSSLRGVDDVTGKSDTMPRGKRTTGFLFPAFILHSGRAALLHLLLQTLFFPSVQTFFSAFWLVIIGPHGL